MSFNAQLGFTRLPHLPLNEWGLWLNPKLKCVHCSFRLAQIMGTLNQRNYRTCLLPHNHLHCICDVLLEVNFEPYVSGVNRNRGISLSVNDVGDFRTKPRVHRSRQPGNAIVRAEPMRPHGRKLTYLWEWRKAFASGRTSAPKRRIELLGRTFAPGSCPRGPHQLHPATKNPSSNPNQANIFRHFCAALGTY